MFIKCFRRHYIADALCTMLMLEYYSHDLFLIVVGKCIVYTCWYSDGLVRDCSDSLANVQELLRSCTTPSICRLWTILFDYRREIHWLPTDICRLLTHWGRVTHICVGNLDHHWFRWWHVPWSAQAIIWTNARILPSRTLASDLSEILKEILLIFLFMKMHLRMSSAKMMSISSPSVS